MPTKKNGRRKRLAKRPGTFHHGDLRRALLEGAMLLLEREGPLGVGLRAAARLAGVSQTAPYRHFPDKESILAALAEEGLRELGDRMAAAALEHSADPRSGLFTIAETYVAFAAERPNLFRLMFGPQVADKRRCPAVEAAGHRAYQVLTDTLEAAQRAGQILPGDIQILALTRWTCVHGLASLILDGRLSEEVAAAGGVRPLARKIAEQLSQSLAASPT